MHDSAMSSPDCLQLLRLLPPRASYTGRVMRVDDPDDARMPSDELGPDHRAHALRARSLQTPATEPLRPATAPGDHGTPVPQIAYFEPKIPGNTGSAIRLSAITGTTLHLVEPLAFDLSDAKLRRAGLDYRDMAHVVVHPNLADLLDFLPLARVFAFTSHSTTRFDSVRYRPGDLLLFGPEPTGLPPEVLAHPRVTERVRIPMRPGLRSLNLTVSAAIAVYEAWGQAGYAGGV